MSDVVSEIVERVRCALIEIEHPELRPLIVGLSGGIDSQVLTHALGIVAESGGPPVHAVHVDHELRPESGDDAAGVQQLCREWGVSCDVVKVDVPGWDAELDQGVESAARHARYAALASTALDNDTDTIVTGHTLNDQAETVMLRLLAGTGLEGLSGMSMFSRRPIALAPGRPAVRRLALFRPLLGISRDRIEAYAAQVGINPIEDPSNQSTAFRRNAIRHNVVPHLLEIEPAALDAIFRTTSTLQDDAGFIADAVDQAFDEIVAERSGVWMLERQQFRSVHAAIQRRVLYRAIDSVLGTALRLSQERLESLRIAAIDGQPGKTIELADDVVGYIDYDRLAIGHVTTLEETLRKLSWIPLLEPGSETRLCGDINEQLSNGWRVRGSVTSDQDVVLRTRRDGDRTRGPRRREIKLQDWFTDQKVPRYLRDWLPLIAVNDEVRWVIGLDITELRDTRSGIDLQLELDILD